MRLREIVTIATGVAVAISVPAAANEPPHALSQEGIVTVRITLNPWGSHLGFAADIAGDDPRLAPLIDLIVAAEPASDHECANRGAIRFELSGGHTIAVGLLPGHEKGFYGFRLYGDARHDGAYSVCRVRRGPFLAVLGELGVPLDDPAVSN